MEIINRILERERRKVYEIAAAELSYEVWEHTECAESWIFENLPNTATNLKTLAPAACYGILSLNPFRYRRRVYASTIPLSTMIRW